MHFTLAGPDIGVRKLDIAGLMSALGEDQGMWAASAATEEAPIEVPDQKAHRLVRVWKPGDETLGYEYFKKRVREPITPAPTAMITVDESPDDDTIVEREFDLPIVPDMPVQKFHQRIIEGNLAIYEASFTMTITMPRTIYVAAPPGQPEAAAEALRRFAADQAMPAGTGLMFDPTIEASVAVTRLVRAGRLKPAGWDIQTEAAKEMPADFARRFASRMIAEDVRAFQEEVGSNADRLTAALRRRL